MGIYKTHRSKKYKIEYKYKLNRDRHLLDSHRFEDPKIGKLMDYLKPQFNFKSEQEAVRFCTKLLREFGQILADDMIYDGASFNLSKHDMGFFEIRDVEKYYGTGQMNWDANGHTYGPKVFVNRNIVAKNKKVYRMHFKKKNQYKLELNIKQGNGYAN